MWPFVEQVCVATIVSSNHMRFWLLSRMSLFMFLVPLPQGLAEMQRFHLEWLITLFYACLHIVTSFIFTFAMNF